MQGEDKPAFFYGLMARWVGDRDRLVAVVRYPGKVMLEEVGVEEVELDESEVSISLPPQITVLSGAGQPTATRQAGQAWREESRG
jgi:hypothetical protein